MVKTVCYSGLRMGYLDHVFGVGLHMVKWNPGNKIVEFHGDII